jgi:hypothetical protein
LARESLAEANPNADATLVSDLDQFFDTLCSMYLGADSERRVEIRSLLESNPRLLGNLYNYAGRAANRLRSTGRTEFLLRGLAASSIDDGRDCRGYGDVLARLYLSASDHGLAPSGAFSTVAQLSDLNTRGFIENF